MSIPASTVFSRVRSALDDDNSERYTETDDLVPAINSAIDYIKTVFTAAFEMKKLHPFVLSELTSVWIFDPDVVGDTANIDLDSYGSHDFNDEVWSIVGVDPNPTVTGSPEVLDESINRFATRIPYDKWNISQDDPFAAGYPNVPSDFLTVCYTGPGNYFNDGSPYLLLRPGTEFAAVGDRVAVWVLLNHTEITAGTGVVQFPSNVIPLIEQKMIQYITYQSADDRLFKITDKEVKELIQLMN